MMQLCFGYCCVSSTSWNAYTKLYVYVIYIFPDLHRRTYITHLSRSLCMNVNKTVWYLRRKIGLNFGIYPFKLTVWRHPMSYQKHETTAYERVRGWICTLGIINGGGRCSHANVSDHPNRLYKRPNDNGWNSRWYPYWGAIGEKELGKKSKWDEHNLIFPWIIWVYIYYPGSIIKQHIFTLSKVFQFGN